MMREARLEHAKTLIPSGVYEQLTEDELLFLWEYTVRKIESYPANFGKTVENYFDLLFPDVVTAHLTGREINRKSAELTAKRKDGKSENTS